MATGVPNQQSVPMATPIQTLPHNTSIAMQPADDDPMVREVLDEMEKQMRTDHPKPSVLHPLPPPPPSNIHPSHVVHTSMQSTNPYPPTTLVMPISPSGSPPSHPLNSYAAHVQYNKNKTWWNTENAQRAVIAAVIALILFQPTTLAAVYKISPLTNRFESYDTYIRTALLAIVLYILLWKFDI